MVGARVGDRGLLPAQNGTRGSLPRSFFQVVRRTRDRRTPARSSMDREKKVAVSPGWPTSLTAPPGGRRSETPGAASSPSIPLDQATTKKICGLSARSRSKEATSEGSGRMATSAPPSSSPPRARAASTPFMLRNPL